MQRKPISTYAIVARKFEETNDSLKSFREELQARGPFNPANTEHVRLIRNKLKSFHAHNTKIGSTDLQLAPLLIFAVATGLYSFLLLVVLLAVAAGLAISQDRFSNGRRQQAGLKELIVLHDWCTENGTKNMDNELVKKLGAAVAPELRNPLDYDIARYEKLSDSTIIQLFKDINHALTVAAYGLPPSEYEKRQAPAEADQQTDAGILMSAASTAWSYMPSLGFGNRS